MNESFMYMYMYLHLKDGVLTFSSGIMHEFKVLLKFLCHDKDDDMLTSVTLLQNFTQCTLIHDPIKNFGLESSLWPHFNPYLLKIGPSQMEIVSVA